MRFYIDTEFDETLAGVRLISIALVCEDGSEFYAVNSDVHPEDCNAWVQEHVWPHVFHFESVPTWIAPPDKIRQEIEAFIGDKKPEFWGYVSAYDWFLFCRLWGTMMDMPQRWPHMCLDLKQEAKRLGVGSLRDHVKPEQPEHNALADARWNRKVHKHLMLVELTRISEDASNVKDLP